MKEVHVHKTLRMACLSRIGDLAQIPMPREGKRTIETMTHYVNDMEKARHWIVELAQVLAGMIAEPEDRQAAKIELIKQAGEALNESEEWLARRRTESWASTPSAG